MICYCPLLYYLRVLFIKIEMVIYSGFSTHRQQQKYNQLTKQLLHLLSQMIITYIESSKLMAFRHSYEKLLADIGKMDDHKYSDLKISVEVQSLTEFILNQQFTLDSFGEPKKKKPEVRHVFRMKRGSSNDGARVVESAKNRDKETDRQKDRRSLSMSGDQRATRHTIGQTSGLKSLTMQELMRLQPQIERKMGSIRKKRYLHPQPNNFPQIQEEEQENDEKE